MAFLDSPIGFAVETHTDPVVAGDSPIGFTIGIHRNPHYPIKIKTAEGWIPTSIGLIPNQFMTTFKETF